MTTAMRSLIAFITLPNFSWIVFFRLDSLFICFFDLNCLLSLYLSFGIWTLSLVREQHFVNFLSSAVLARLLIKPRWPPGKHAVTRDLFAILNPFLKRRSKHITALTDTIFGDKRLFVFLRTYLTLRLGFIDDWCSLTLSFPNLKHLVHH